MMNLVPETIFLILDVKNIKTRAEDKGDHYVLNGSKTYITNGVYGDFVTLKIWRQKNFETKGRIVNYEINNISP